MTHTPTPWTVTSGRTCDYIVGADGITVATCPHDPLGTDRAGVNASHIVNAVNAYDEMLAALRWYAFDPCACQPEYGPGEMCGTCHARAAIAEAEGRA